MTEQEAFVTRLRRRRERNRIPLEEIAQDTRVKLELLQELERNDLSNWPRGLYARAYIRAYASAIGLDGNDAVDEFCRLFPQGDRRTEPVIREMAVIVASQTEYRYDYRYATEVDRRRSAEADMLRCDVAGQRPRVAVADRVAAFVVQFDDQQGPRVPRTRARGQTGVRPRVRVVSRLAVFADSPPPLCLHPSPSLDSNHDAGGDLPSA